MPQQLRECFCNIIKDDDGGLPEFWLSLFRNWLLKLQMCFIDDDRWTKEASDDAILVYKLLVQTGHVDPPFKSQETRVCFSLSDWSLSCDGIIAQGL